jgi:dethiobiotin synthetase
MRALFITGTDTDAGKTHVTVGLISAWRTRGRRVVGMKPVASGSTPTSDGLRNADALALMALSHGAPAYATVNPYCFAPPIAPHRAAELAGVEIDLERIAAAFDRLAAGADAVLVEGAGGWCVPLGSERMTGDLVGRLALPVLLVVGLRLGCINHGLLSARAILADGQALIGWVGNRVDPAMLEPEASIAALRARMPVPCLGIVAYGAEPDPALAEAIWSACPARPKHASMI